MNGNGNGEDKAPQKEGKQVNITSSNTALGGILQDHRGRSGNLIDLSSMPDYNLGRTVMPVTQFNFPGQSLGSLDIGLSPYADQIETRALNQTGWRLAGNALAQSVSQVGLGTLEGIGYLLDWEQMANLADGTEQEFGNWFSDLMREGQEAVREELPIYRTKASEGFNPGNRIWWAANLPSIFSTLSLAIPTVGSVKMLGRAGKLLGGQKILKGLGTTGKEMAALRGIEGAFISRYMENTMESTEVAQGVYEKAIAEGKSDEDARLIAGEAGRNTWYANSANLVFDIPQYMLMFRGFKNAKKLLGPLEQPLLRYPTGILTEAAEEVGQFVIGEEAARAAEIKGGLSEDNRSFTERLQDYASNEELWTSAFIGGLGGGVFTAASDLNTQFDKATASQRETIAQSLSQKEQAVRHGNPYKWSSSQDEDYIKMLVPAAIDGRTDQVKRDIEGLLLSEEEGMEMSGINKEDLAKEAPFRIQQADFAAQAYDAMNKEGKSDEVIRYELGLRIAENMAERRSLEYNTIFSDLISKATLSNSLDSRMSSLKKLEAEKKAYQEIGDEKSASDISNQIESLQKEIIEDKENDVYKSIKSKSAINKKLQSSYDKEIEKAAQAYVGTINDLALIKEDISNLDSPKKSKEVQKRFDQRVDSLNDEQLEVLKEEVTEQSSPDQIQGIRKRAKDIGRLNEMDRHIREKIVPFDRETGIRKGAEVRIPSQENKVFIYSPVTDKNGVIKSHQFIDRSSPANVITLKNLDQVQPEDSATTSNLSEVPVKNNNYENATSSQSDSGLKEEKKVKEEEKSFVERESTKAKRSASQSNVSVKTNKFPEEKNVFYVKTIYNFEEKADAFERQQMGVDFQRMNDPTLLSGVLRVKLEDTPFGEGLYVVTESGTPINKILENPEGVGNDYRQKIAAFKEYIKTKPDRTVSVNIRDNIEYTANRGEEHSIKDLLDNERALQHLPNGQVFLGDVMNNMMMVSSEIPGSVVNNLPNNVAFMVVRSPRGDLIPEGLDRKPISDLFVGGKSLSDIAYGRIQQAVKDAEDLIREGKIKDNNDLYAFWDGRKEEVEEIVGVSRKDFTVRMGIDKNNPNAVNVYLKGGYTGNIKELIKERFFNLNAEKLVNPRGFVFEGVAYPTYQDFILENDIFKTRLVTEAPFINTQIEVVLPEEVTAQEYRKSDEEVLEEEVGQGLDDSNELEEELFELDRILNEPNINQPIPTEDTKDVATRRKFRESYEVWDQEKELEWLNNNLPAIPVEVFNSTLDIYNKFGEEAYGVFSNATIYLSENTEIGTSYHEAFHAVFRLYLNEKTRSNLLRNNTEEELSEMFRDYVITNGNEKPSSNILEKFFRDLWYWVKDVTGLLKVKDLFQYINKGGFSQKLPLERNYEQFKSNVATRLIEGFTGVEQKRRVETMAYQFFNGLRYRMGLNNFLQISPADITSQLYEEVFNLIKRNNDLLYQRSPSVARKKIVDNFDNLKLETTKYINRFGFRIREDINERLAEMDDDSSRERVFDKPVFENKRYDTINSQIKSYIAFLPMIDAANASSASVSGSFEFLRDDLGMVRFQDLFENYKYLSENLSDIPTIEGMIDKLQYLALSRPQLYKIIYDLTKSESITDDGIRSDVLRSRFFSAFANQNNKFVTLRRDVESKYDPQPRVRKNEYSFNIFQTNKNKLSNVIFNTWKRNVNYNNVSSKLYEEYKREVSKNENLINQRDHFDSLNIIKNYLGKAGIDIDKRALSLHKEEYFRSNYDESGGLLEGSFSYSSYVVKTNAPTIGQILNSYAQGRFLYGEQKGEGEVTAIQLLAKYESSVNTDITGGAFLNGENNQVYPINLPTKAGEIKNELKQGSFIGMPISRVLEDPYYKYSKVLNDLKDDKYYRDWFDFTTFDTFFKNGKDTSGIAYKNIDDKTFESVKLSSFHNAGKKHGWFFIPTPSDRSHTLSVRLNKFFFSEQPLFSDSNFTLNRNTPFYSWLVNTVKGEYERILKTWEDVKEIPTDRHYKGYHYEKKIGDNKGNAFYFNLFPDLNRWVYDKPSSPLEPSKDFFDIDDMAELHLLLSDIMRKSFSSDIKYFQQKGIAGRYNKEKGTLEVFDGVLPSSINNATDFIFEFLANQYYANIELTRLLNGDIAFYKGDVKDSDGIKIKNIDVNKRFGASMTPGYKLNTPNTYSGGAKENFGMVVLEDESLTSDYLESYKIFLEEKGLSEQKIVSILTKYSQNEHTDGQGFVSLERLRDIMIGSGTFTSEYEAAYTNVLSGMGNTANFEKVFQPIKGYYYGQQMDDRGTIYPVMIKYSSVPLIPQFVERSGNERLKDLYDFIEENKLDEVVFSSALKATPLSTTVDRSRPVVHRLSNKNYRIPQVVPYKESVVERFSSQKKKLIMENVEDENLVKEYNSLVSTLIRNSLDAVIPSINNIEKLADSLLTSLNSSTSSAIPDNYEKALEVIDTEFGKDTRLSLDDPLIKKKVESIYHSLIEKGVVDQKLPGLSAVLVSTFGTVAFSDDLKFVRLQENKVLPSEIRLTPKFFIQSLKRQGVNLDLFLDEQGELDINLIPEELRVGTLHGTPVQGKNAMMPFVVKEFLPYDMGTSIQVPFEMITQSGKDFDIDKLYLELPYFTVKDGALEKVKYEEGKSLEAQSMEAIKNRVIDIHYDVLTRLSSFEEMIIPNNADTLIQIREEVINYYPQRGSNLWFQNNVQASFRTKNLAGKSLIGSYSIASTSHATAQLIDLSSKKEALFDGRRLTSLSSIYDYEGNLISNNLQEGQTAAVDNAKDPILGDLNDNSFTNNVVTYLTRTGVPLRSTYLLVNQPVVRELTELYFQNEGQFSKKGAYDRVLTQLMNKYKLPEKIRAEEYVAENINTKNLEDGLSYYESAKKQLSPEQVLGAFVYYKRLGDNLQMASISLRTDAKGVASSVVENVKTIENLERLKDNPYLLYNQNKYDDSYLDAYQEAIEESLEYGKQYFSDATPLFSEVRNKMSAIKGSPLSEQESNHVTYSLYSFLFNDAEGPFGNVSNDEKNILLKGDLSLGQRILNYNKNVESSGRNRNKFLDSLLVEKDENTGIDLVSFPNTTSGALSPEEREDISNSILDLYRSADEREKQLAVDLFKYSFFTNGFLRTADSFIDYIPIEVYEGLGFPSFYRTQRNYFGMDTENTYSDPFGRELFYDQYVQNHFQGLGWLRSIRIKDFDVLSDDPNLNKTFTSRVEKLGYPAYVVLNDRLYKSEESTYKLLNTLGLKNRLVEYNRNGTIDRSIIPSNNVQVFYQEESRLNRQIYSENVLKEILNKLSKKFDIPYVISDKEGMQKKFGKNLKGAFVKQEGKIPQVWINGESFMPDTPFHEFAHPFVLSIYNKNPLLYKNISGKLKDSEVGKKLIDEAKKIYDTDLEAEMEAIVTLLGEYASDKVPQTEKSLLNTIQLFLKRMADFVKGIFVSDKVKTIFPEKIDPAMSLSHLAQLMSEDGSFIDLGDVGESMYFQKEKEKSILDYMKLQVSRQIAIYERRAKEEGKPIPISRLKYVKSQLNVLEEADAVNLFIDEAKENTQAVHARLKNLVVNKNKNIADIRPLVDAYEYIQGYDVLDKIKKYIRDNEGIEGIPDKLRDALDMREEIESDFFQVGIPLLAKWLLKDADVNAINQEYNQVINNIRNEKRLIQLNKNDRAYKKLRSEYKEKKGLLWYWKDGINKEEFYERSLNLNIAQIEQKLLTEQNMIDWLTESARDKSTFSYMLDPFIYSSDPSLSLFGFNIKNKLRESSLKTLDKKWELKKEYDNFREATGRSEDNVSKFNEGLFEEVLVRYRNEEGDIIKIPMQSFIQPFDINAFNSNLEIFTNKINKKYKAPKQESQEYKQFLRTDKGEAYLNELADWYKQNTKPVADAKSRIKEKEDEIKKINEEVAVYKKRLEEKDISEEEVFYQMKSREMRKIEISSWLENNRSWGSKSNSWSYKGELAEPSEKYRNQRWVKLQEDDGLKRYYDYLISMYFTDQDSLPDSVLRKNRWDRNSYLLPTVRKDQRDRLLEQGPIATLKDTALESIQIQATDTEFGMLRQLNEQQKFIPVFYTNPVEAKDVSVDLATSILRFHQMANDYVAKSEVQSEVNLMKYVIGNREVAQTNSKGQKLFDAFAAKIGIQEWIRKPGQSNSFKALDEFINMVYYGENQIKEEIAGIDLNKVSSTLSYVTSVNGLAANALQGVNNVILGKVMTFAEGAGGKFYKPKNWIASGDIYWRQSGAALSDIGKFKSESKLGQLIDLFDPMQGRFQTTLSENVTGSQFKKLFTRDAFFFMQHGGEHELQVRTMISMMDSYKVKNQNGKDILNKDGKPMSLWDAYSIDSKTGRVGLDNRVKNFNTKDKDIFINRLHGINGKLHGKYNSFDKSALKRRWYGQLVMLFRGWVVPGLRRRFGHGDGLHTDTELQSVSEGTYLSFYRMLKESIGEKRAPWGIYHKMTDLEQQNVRRTLVEINAMMASMVIVAALRPDADREDKNNYSENFLLYQARRLQAELLFYTSPGEFWKIMKSPTATINYTEKLIKFVDQGFNPFETYKRKTGIYEKGDSKLLGRFTDLIPVINNVEKARTPEDAYKWFTKNF